MNLVAFFLDRPDNGIACDLTVDPGNFYQPFFEIDRDLRLRRILAAAPAAHLP